MTSHSEWGCGFCPESKPPQFDVIDEATVKAQREWKQNCNKCVLAAIYLQMKANEAADLEIKMLLKAVLKREALKK